MLGIVRNLILCAATVKAVEYFGQAPSIDQYNAIEQHSAFMENNGIKLASILRTSGRDNEHITKFLASAGIYNTTIDELKSNNVLTVPNSIVKRAPTTSCSTTNKVQVTDLQQFQICSTLAALAGGTVGTVAYIIQGLSCSVSSNGHPTFCNGVFIFFGTSSAALSGLEVSQYCPNFLTTIDTTCNEKGGDATEDNEELVVQITQSSVSCDGIDGACTQTKVG